jgi:hypothetical protein
MWNFPRYVSINGNQGLLPAGASGAPEQNSPINCKFAAQLKKMSNEESSERQRAGRGYRTPLDLGMGIFYVIIGFYFIIAKSFGDMKIPPFIAYILGGMMVIGGGFRFYRGLVVILPKKKDK